MPNESFRLSLLLLVLLHGFTSTSRIHAEERHPHSLPVRHLDVQQIHATAGKQVLSPIRLGGTRDRDVLFRVAWNGNFKTKDGYVYFGSNGMFRRNQEQIRVTFPANGPDYALALLASANSCCGDSVLRTDLIMDKLSFTSGGNLTPVVRIVQPLEIFFSASPLECRALRWTAVITFPAILLIGSLLRQRSFFIDASQLSDYFRPIVLENGRMMSWERSQLTPEHCHVINRGFNGFERTLTYLKSNPIRLLLSAELSYNETLALECSRSNQPYSCELRLIPGLKNEERAAKERNSRPGIFNAKLLIIATKNGPKVMGHVSPDHKLSNLKVPVEKKLSDDNILEPTGARVRLTFHKARGEHLGWWFPSATDLRPEA